MQKTKLKLCEEMLEAGQRLLELRRAAILAGKPLPWQQKPPRKTNDKPLATPPTDEPKEELLPADRMDQVIDLYLAGVSVKDISAKLDVNTQVIYSEIKWARETGRLPQKIRKKAEVLRLIESGLSPEEAAAAVGGVSYSFMKKIKRVARQNGILK